MDNIDKALNKVKKVASAAYDKTEEVINIQKKKIELVALNSKLKDAFTKLGENLYDKGINLETEEPLAKEIKEIKNEIAAIRADIRKAQYKDICIACGKEIAKGTAYCSHCGAKQED